MLLLQIKLTNVNWDNVYKTEDVNRAYDMFYSVFFSKFNDCCPLTNVTIKRRNVKPWLTKGLINACHKKKILYKEQLNNPSDLNMQRYKRYKNKLTSILRKAEKMYYLNKMFKYKGKMKETWSVLNELLGKNVRKSTMCDHILKDNVKVTNPSTIAN